MADTQTHSRARSLVVESAGAVTIDGQRFELPAIQFALLAALAERPGESVPASILIDIVWPDIAGITARDVYWHIWRLRKKIRDQERLHPLIANRRSFGYYIDLPAGAVRIVNGHHDEEVPEQQIIVLPEAEEPQPIDAPVDLTDTIQVGPEDRPVPLQDLEPSATTPLEVIAASPRRLPRVAIVTVAALLVTVLVTLLALRSPASSDPPASPTKDPLAEARDHKPNGEGRRQEGGNRKGTHRAERSQRDGGADEQPGNSDQQVVTATVPGSTGTEPSTSDGKAPQPSSEEKPVALPPAPGNHLYHLHNPDSGDHFVTTDPAAANDYRGRGYVGGVIARVYVRAEDGTKPISTNGGVAYVFATARPKTEPSVNTLPLYFASNGAGDFFYTTRNSEASAEGWTSSLVGYVAAP